MVTGHHLRLREGYTAVLIALDGLAEFERELIRSRTGEGRATAQGVKLGRKPKLTPHQRQEALARREAGELRPASRRQTTTMKRLLTISAVLATALLTP